MREVVTLLVFVVEMDVLQGCDMLVLNREVGESIIIDGKIEIKICDIRKRNSNAQIRLGITAPKGVEVHRKEIQEIIDREKILSGTGSLS